MKEEWKPIANFPDYQVSNLGRVRRITRTWKPAGYILKCLRTFHNPTPYHAVTLWRGGKSTRKYIHHLVAEAFIRPRKSREQINHLDFNGCNNQVKNLEYSTNKLNRQYSKLHGRHIHGSRMWSAKLTERDIPRIRRLLKENKLSRRQIAEQYGVWPGQIDRIAWNIGWTHVPHQVASGCVR